MQLQVWRKQKKNTQKWLQDNIKGRSAGQKRAISKKIWVIWDNLIQPQTFNFHQLRMDHKKLFSGRMMKQYEWIKATFHYKCVSFPYTSWEKNVKTQEQSRVRDEGNYADYAHFSKYRKPLVIGAPLRISDNVSVHYKQTKQIFIFTADAPRCCIIHMLSDQQKCKNRVKLKKRYIVIKFYYLK